MTQRLEIQQTYIPSDESLEQGRNRSRELHFTAEQPNKPDLASVGNSLAGGPPPPPDQGVFNAVAEQHKCGCPFGCQTQGFDVQQIAFP